MTHTGWDACILQCLSPPYYASHLLGSRNLFRLALRVNGPSDSARRSEARPHLLSKCGTGLRHKSRARHPILLPRGGKGTSNLGRIILYSV